MPIFRKRIENLAELSEAIVALNNKLNALYGITRSISSTNRFEQVLGIVSSELAGVMNVDGISIKLLSEDGQHLHYAAVHGLPAEFSRDKVVEVAKSPLNRRIIEGEPFVAGNLTRREMFQFGEDLAAAGIQSVLFVALKVEGRVTGILGAYSKELNRFGVDEVDFFRMAAGLVAVALENAQAFEAIEKLVKERSWFMMRVAHNLRAPLAGMKSMLNLMTQGDYLGEMNENQRHYLDRVDQRCQAMLAIVNELMTLAEARSEKRKALREPVDLGRIAGRIQDIFQGEAVRKEIDFSLTMPEGLPLLQGDPEMIEQMLENLVSNGIKYTQPGGRVSLKFSLDSDEAIRIQVCDTGIGIPKDALPRLFTEFFRAENAKKAEETGTGLGLAFVKDVVLRHGGRIAVETEEGKGSTFCLHLPIKPHLDAASTPLESQ
jgi:signal transduction histidine kinase